MDSFLHDKDLRHERVKALILQTTFHGEKMKSFLSEISADERLFKMFESIPLYN